MRKKERDEERGRAHRDTPTHAQGGPITHKFAWSNKLKLSSPRGIYEISYVRKYGQQLITSWVQK